jgi:RNA polymerase sigma factor (sigma-70 family)
VGTPDAAWSADVEFLDYVRARQHTLLRAAYLVCGDLPLAENLLEAALVRLARDWGEVRDEQPDVHVRQILYRDAVASSRPRPQEVAVPEPGGPGPGKVEDAEGQDAEDDDDDEEDEDEEAQQRRDVLHALEALTARQRAVVVLRHFEDRTEGDVARILGISVASVTRETDEALGRLRVALPRVDLGTGGPR